MKTLTEKIIEQLQSKQDALNQLKSENEELKKQLDEAIIENGKESGFWGRIASRKTNENKELKNSLKEVLSQLEDRGGFDAIVLGIKQLLTNDTKCVCLYPLIRTSEKGGDYCGICEKDL